MILLLLAASVEPNNATYKDNSVQYGPCLEVESRDLADACPKSYDEINIRPPSPLNAPWITFDDYPPLALDEKRFGNAVYSVDVGRDGRVIRCAVTKSTGHADLDGAICPLIAKRARYRTAIDEQKNPVAYRHYERASWSLPPTIVGLGEVRSVTPVAPGSILTKSGSFDPHNLPYPAVALAAGIQGRVAILVDVSSSRDTTKCTVIESSGSSELDDASCRIISSREAGVAATDSSGEKIDAQFNMLLTWTLQPSHKAMQPSFAE